MSTKAELRAELEDTRHAYHALLASVPDAAFDQPSDNPAWTIGEVLYHMSLAPRMVGTDVKAILGQGWLLRLVPVIVPRWLFNWLNKVGTRFVARGLTHNSLADAYDKAHAATLRSLDSISEEDLSKGLNYPDWDPLLSGEVTVERLFHYITLHFEAHEAQVRGRVAAFEAERS